MIQTYVVVNWFDQRGGGGGIDAAGYLPESDNLMYTSKDKWHMYVRTRAERILTDKDICKHYLNQYNGKMNFWLFPWNPVNVSRNCSISLRSSPLL